MQRAKWIQRHLGSSLNHAPPECSTHETGYVKQNAMERSIAVNAGVSAVFMVCPVSTGELPVLSCLRFPDDSEERNMSDHRKQGFTLFVEKCVHAPVEGRSCP